MSAAVKTLTFLFLLTMVCASVGICDTLDVSIKGRSFIPAKISVKPGDVVRWTNNARMGHTSTSKVGGWDSGKIQAGQSFAQAFLVAGTFKYVCLLHSGMTGLVEVKAVASGDQGAAENPKAPAQTPPKAMPKATPSGIDSGGGYK